jgi:uncharacterized damage-inducible protein DinB
MNKGDVELLAKYNKETNEKINGIIKNLSEEEWNRQFHAYYKSIHELCSHIFITDYTWLKRFTSMGNFRSLDAARFGKEYSFKEILFENTGEYLANRPELDNIIIDFADELTARDLTCILRWIDSGGMVFEKRLEVALMHLVNHETYHRGMLSLYLEMIGKENDYSNLYPYG